MIYQFLSSLAFRFNHSSIFQNFATQLAKMSPRTYRKKRNVDLIDRSQTSKIENTMLLFKIKLTREEQVGFVSSEAAYRRVLESFQEETLDIFFIKEQVSVYKWRKAFFLKHFQAGSWRTDCNFLCTAGMCEENHYEAAIHYNILHNFDTVMNLAFTLPKPNYVFFPSDFFCTHVNSKYDFSSHSDSEIVSQLINKTLLIMSFSSTNN